MGDQIRAAAKGWSGREGAPSSAFSDATSAMAPGFDGQNGVFYAPGGSAQANGALAITVLSYDDKTGQILDADVIVNGKYSFAILQDGTKAPKGTKPVANDANKDDASEQDDKAPQFDIVHVVAHEFGHTMGLVDEPDQSTALMYRYTSPGDATLRAPSDYDLANVQQIYSQPFEGGAQATAGGCGGASLAPHGERSGHLGFLPFALGGVGMIALSRRRNQRIRVAGVGVLAAAAFATVPNVAKSAQSSSTASHADARVVSVNTTSVGGLFHSTVAIATDVCHVASCPTQSGAHMWGGTIGGIAQIVGEEAVPQVGARVHVKFDKVRSTATAFVPSTFGRSNVAVQGEARIVAE